MTTDTPSVGREQVIARVVWEMRDAATDGDDPQFHVGAALQQWADRLAAASPSPGAVPQGDDIADVRYRLDCANAFGDQCMADIDALLIRAEKAEAALASQAARMGERDAALAKLSAALRAEASPFIRHRVAATRIADELDALLQSNDTP